MPSPLKILHLEDVQSDAQLITRSLRQKGVDFENLIVDNKKDYTNALNSYSPDIILSDHSLPGFDSFEALEILKASHLHIPFILITSAMRDEIAVQILKSGASDYILKDRLERLPAAIANSLERYRLEQEKQEYIDRLESNERRYRLLLENGSDPVMLMDEAGKINYTSSNIKKILGYTEQEALNLDLYTIYHPEDVQAAFGELKGCLKQPGEHISCSAKRMKHKNGNWRWIEVTLSNLLGNPDVNGIVNNLRDVTERRNSEQTIRESEEKYRSFFENSLDGILLTAPDGRVFAANPAACKIFRMTEKEICEAGREGLCDMEDPRLYKALQDRASNGKTTTEITMVRKGGEKFPAELTSSVFKDAKGALRTSMAIRDVSEKKEAQEKLISSEEKYRLLFEYNPLPNWIYENESLKIIDVNQAAINHYGYSYKEFLQMNIMDLREEEERERLYELLKTLRKEKQGNKNLYSGKFRHLKKDKTSIIVEIFSYQIQLDKKECSLVISHDITEKEKAVEQLRVKSEQLTTAERIAKLGYFKHDLKNDMIFWTDEVFRIWELSRENFTPSFENLLATVHPEDRNSLKAGKEAAHLGPSDFELEHRILLKEGIVKWIHVRGKVIKNEKGIASGIEGTLQDITTFKQAQEKLAISEARFRSLIQSQTNYVVRVDLEGNYVYCNETFLKDYSWLYPDGSIIGKNSLSSIEEYHHQRTIDTVEKCFEFPNTVFQVEIDKPAKDGGVNTTLWDFICLTDPKGNPEEVQSIGINITDRVEAEKANRFQANLLDKIGQAVLSTDTNGQITFWNRSAEKIYGWTRDEALGRSITNIIPLPESEEKTFRNIENLQPGEVRSGEFLVKKKNGSVFPVLTTDSPIYNENGALTGMVSISSDITERKEADLKMQKMNRDLKAYTQELVTANKGLEQFSYIVSHNLRAPVANILGLGNMIQTEDYPEKVKDQLAEELLNNVSRLDAVIRDLNEILNVKSNILTHKEPVELTGLINSIKMSIKDLIDNENVKIITDFSRMQEFKTVHSYLYSIFYNLILNSIKYRQPNLQPIIEIKGEKKDDKFIFLITDNGLGIDLSKKGEQVFGLYKRFHHHVEGKGMGLFMVKTQVEMLGGKISVFSKPNEGTTFVIEIKASDQTITVNSEI